FEQNAPLELAPALRPGAVQQVDERDGVEDLVIVGGERKAASHVGLCRAEMSAQVQEMRAAGEHPCPQCRLGLKKPEGEGSIEAFDRLVGAVLVVAGEPEAEMGFGQVAADGDS